MRNKLQRIPLPLVVALAVAVGASVAIVVNIVTLPPPAGIAAPIETPATALETGTYTHILTVEALRGQLIKYPTLAGLGKLQLESNTTGWYYLQNDLFVTLVRRSTGDATFTIGIDEVYVKEINDTHAFILFRYVGVVTKKVQVSGLWVVYHPVATDYDSTTLNAITALMSARGMTVVDVFQPRADYLQYDDDIRSFKIFVDVVQNDGTVQRRHFYYTNATSFTPILPDSPVLIDGFVDLGGHNYALYPVWVLFYYHPNVSIKSELKVAPIE